MRINTDQLVGRYQIAIQSELPNSFEKAERKRRKAAIRDNARYVQAMSEGICFGCKEDMPSILIKHHLVPVASYAHRGNELNQHMVCLCLNCHLITHNMYEGKLSPEDIDKLKERGHWQRFVEIDRMASKALIGVKYR
jgi:hypothetical protein